MTDINCFCIGSTGLFHLLNNIGKLLGYCLPMFHRGSGADYLHSMACTERPRWCGCQGGHLVRVKALLSCSRRFPPGFPQMQKVTSLGLRPHGQTLDPVDCYLISVNPSDSMDFYHFHTFISLRRRELNVGNLRIMTTSMVGSPIIVVGSIWSLLARQRPGQCA